MAGEGTWRPFLDEVVLKGAVAHALDILSAKALNQARTDLATSRTRLGSIAAVHALIVTALAKIATHAGEASDAMVLAAAELVKGVTDLDAGITAQNSAISTALTNAITELGKVNTDLTAAEGVWTSQAHHMTTDDATVDMNAQDYLEAGDAKIDQVNLGAEVAELYATYTQREIDLAGLWAAKRADFLTEAQRHTETMNGYFGEAVNRLGLISRYIEQSEAHGGLAGGYVAIAVQRLGMCQEYSRESQQRIEEERTYIAEAEQYRAVAAQEVEASNLYRQKSIDAMAEFKGVLNDRAQYRTNVFSASTSQPR